MENRPQKTLAFPVRADQDHILGSTDAEMTLVEYGSYACARCHTVHEVVEGLRNRFGERMKYVFRHLPTPDSEVATRAAELAEYAAQTTGRFWEVHEALMEHGPGLSGNDLEQVARDCDLPHEKAPTNKPWMPQNPRCAPTRKPPSAAACNSRRRSTSTAGSTAARGMKAR